MEGELDIQHSRSSLGSFNFKKLSDGTEYDFPLMCKCYDFCIDGGVEVKTRSYHLKKYPKCVTGTKLVRAFMGSGLGINTEEEAVLMGRALVDNKFLEHVCQDHDFKNEKLFYQFTNKEDNEEAIKKFKEMKSFRKISSQPSFTGTPTLFSTGSSRIEVNQISEMTVKMQESLDIRDRVYMLKTYKNCFLGNEAADWILQNKYAQTVREAVALGQRLVDTRIIEHVTQEHPFKDEPLFYHFVSESESLKNARTYYERHGRKTFDFGNTLPWLTLAIWSSLYFTVPLTMLFLFILFAIIPNIWTFSILFITVCGCFTNHETWPGFWKVFKYWHKIFSFQGMFENKKAIDESPGPFMISTIPHGIAPLGNYLTLGFIEDHWNFEKHGRPTIMIASIIFRLPIFRQVHQWIGCKPVSRSEIINELNEGRSIAFTPGGIAEIFLSRRDREIVYLNHRKGFCKLSLQTGAQILPVYIFGQTQLYDQPIRADASGWLAQFSRKFQGSFTWFWGQYYTFVPYQAPITVACGAPLPKRDPIPNPTDEQIDELHYAVTESVKHLYEKYKLVAGYPEDKKLEFAEN